MEKLGYKHVKGWLFRNQRGSQVELRNGEVVTKMAYGDTFDVDALKRGYSVGTIKKMAKTYGWKLKETSENNFEVEKQY